MTITSNLLKHWQSATPSHRREGRSWYCRVGALVTELARESGSTRSVVAGVLAATSPRQTWKRNVHVTRELLAGRAVAGVFTQALDKARRIIGGAKPLGVLGGDKVRAFYRALMGDRSAAVIDVWMLRAAGLNPESRLDRNGLYNKVVGALRALATRLRIAVADLQATLWVAVRGRSE